MSKSIRVLLCVLLLGAVPAWGQISLSTTGPAISYIEPTSAPVGAPSVLLTVYGKNFVSGATITWNGTAMPTTYVASGKLYTTVPGKYLLAPATVKIAVAVRLGSTPAVPFTITSGASSNTDSATGQSNTDSITSSTTFALATALPGGTVGAAYRASLVKGGTPPYTMALAGVPLPAGITFDGATGYLVGAPKAAGNYAFGVSVRDSAAHSGTRNYTLSVLGSSMIESNTTTALRITTTSLPAGNVGSAYSATLAATGGRPPYAWRIMSGSLPPGLALNGTTGAITGTPTLMVTASFVAEVKDTAAGTASYTFSVTIGASSQIMQEIPH